MFNRNVQGKKNCWLLFVFIYMIKDNFAQKFCFAAKEAKKSKDDDDLAELMSWAN